VQAIWRGEASAGAWQLRMDLSSEPSGLYWVRAEESGAGAVRRLVVIH